MQMEDIVSDEAHDEADIIKTIYSKVRKVTVTQYSPPASSFPITRILNRRVRSNSLRYLSIVPSAFSTIVLNASAVHPKITWAAKTRSDEPESNYQTHLNLKQNKKNLQALSQILTLISVLPTGPS